jgi:hypothetical protein
MDATEFSRFTLPVGLDYLRRETDGMWMRGVNLESQYVAQSDVVLSRCDLVIEVFHGFNEQLLRHIAVANDVITPPLP